MNFRLANFAATLLLLLTAPTFADDNPWQKVLDERVSLYGRDNWIVIADSGFPLLSRDGIQTLQTNAEAIEVLKRVIESINVGKRLRVEAAYTTELHLIPEADAPGITQYRSALDQMLAGQDAQAAPFDQLMTGLNRQAEGNHVLVLKTNLAIPYSSVFLRLDYGNWSADKEARLRTGMAQHANGK